MAGGVRHRSTPGNTGGQSKMSTGIYGLYHRKPIPINHAIDRDKLMREKNGPVKVIKPADPTKLKEVQEAKENNKHGRNKETN